MLPAFRLRSTPRRSAEPAADLRGRMMIDGHRPETTVPERRDDAGRFMPGNSGRPRGARHAALLALDAIGADNARDVMQAVVDAARGGDMRAAEILLSRLWPQRKGRPVALDLPALNTA